MKSILFFILFVSTISFYSFRQDTDQNEKFYEKGNISSVKPLVKNLPGKTAWKELNVRGLVGIKADGSLWIWKYKNRKSFTFEKLGNESDWKHIYYGGSIAIAMKEDGTLWSWGNKTKNGQPGRKISKDKDIPSQIGTESWIDVSVGNSFVLAIKSDGTLWGWGENKFGRIDPDVSAEIINEPVQKGTDNNWKSIFASDNGKSYGIKSDGTMWVFYKLDKLYEKVPLQVGNDYDWEFCKSENLAIKKDGTLWSVIWGARNALTDMETAIGIPQNFLLHDTKQIGTDNDWKCAYLYDEKLLALKKDRTIWSCKIPFTHGKISDESVISPIQLGKDNNWEYINTYIEDISLGIKSDGTAFYWGEKSDKYFEKEEFLNNGISKAEF